MTPDLASTSAQSTITNKSRLRLLHKREEILQQIFSALREPPTPLCDLGGVYDSFLEGVIAEGFMHVMEPAVTIHCRKSDVENVKTAAAKASNTYQDLSGIGVSFDVLGSIADEWYALVLTIFCSAGS
jgi:V-type H+-transporting ATPase subunit E